MTEQTSDKQQQDTLSARLRQDAEWFDVAPIRHEYPEFEEYHKTRDLLREAANRIDALESPRPPLAGSHAEKLALHWINEGKKRTLWNAECDAEALAHALLDERPSEAK